MNSALMDHPPTYEAFLEDYQRAREAYERAVFRFQSFPVRDNSPESYDAADRLSHACDTVNAASRALTRAPAPDLAAVAFKLERLLGYMEEVEYGDAPLRSLRRAIATAKAGKARTAHKLAAPAVKWADGQTGYGMECPEKNDSYRPAKAVRMNDTATVATCFCCRARFIGVPGGLCPECEKDSEFYRLSRKKGDPRKLIPYL